MPASFSTLPLSNALLTNLKDLGYKQATDIQAAALPDILDGQDIIGQAKTGSGKTAAFGLGILHKLQVKRFRIQSLVLCPTRELADQVATEIRTLGRGIHNIKVLTLCGGTPFGPQIHSLEHGAHIIVGTPGRIEEHLRKGHLKLQDVQTLVLDEADRMLDMGFQESVDKIVEQVPQKRQTLLFSATFPKQIETLSRRIMNQPSRVEVEATHEQDSIEQYFYPVATEEARAEAALQLLLHHQPRSSIVFCNTKADTKKLTAFLQSKDVSAQALHGDLEQRERDQALVCFSNQSLSVLIATDVAARGLDIDALDLVINFQMPRETEVYIHRIGRTGRAGKNGMACTLLTEKESFKLARLEELGYVKPAKQRLPKPSQRTLIHPPNVTLQIDGGKKQKLRPGDIVGALTKDKQITFDKIGKIQVKINRSYVAIAESDWKLAFKLIDQGQLKGRKFKVRKIDF